MSQLTFDDLFADEKQIVAASPSPLSSIQLDILELINEEQISVMDICEKLIKSGKISKERFSTNKPKEYVKVCFALEGLVNDGELIFVEDIEKKDRIYSRKITKRRN
ncbi:DUF3895 domain-containing protein [Neobacillus notoginsengisoli]|uniref:DUF3895 domain-containing protein n=1 Tax=Neobacillus notoginsengisoli TaxID=1578198 RepID=A0A417YQ97_9BACI|nr:DUF3895 domain-containing protein [Neobacillus notoginsengisoli]RHW36012.1 DUF3895 domain-containing protein [Neobacillus notoginsengisoli]